MGCSRSGTTLLQSLLASHSQVHTFPETGVFLKALGMRSTVLPWVRMGLTLGKERKALTRLLASQQGAPGRLPPLPSRRLLLSRSLADVADFLDGLASAHGKTAWVEKTPRHVFHARRIAKAVPGGICIHMVRRGEDVVASIVDRATRYPDRFPRQSDPAYGVRQWNRSMRATAAAMSDPGHLVVLYEKLVADVEETLRAVCSAVGLEFEAGMVVPANRSAFAGAEEEWKSAVDGPVRPSPSKFNEVLSEDSRDQIPRRLETGIYQALVEGASESPGGILVSGAGDLTGP